MRRLILCVLLCALLLPSLVACRAASPEGLYIRVLDVGQSDAVLLSFGGQHLLVDTGTATQRNTLLSALDALEVESLSLLITHPHEDHYGNARALLEHLPVQSLILGGKASAELGYRLMLETAIAQGTPLQTWEDGLTLSLGGAVVEVLCPMPEAEEPNDASLILRVRYGSCMLLLMGDAEQEAEQALLPALQAGEVCDLLKVGHHGSDTATTAAFLAAITPKNAAISCGRDNEFAFPHAAVLSALDAVGCNVYRTDLLGDLNFYCDGTEVRFLGE